MPQKGSAQGCRRDVRGRAALQRRVPATNMQALASENAFPLPK